MTRAFGHAVTLRDQARCRSRSSCSRCSSTRSTTSSRCCRRASSRTRTRATRSRRSSCRTRRASSARRPSPSSVDAMFAKIPGVDNAHDGHRLQPARHRLQDQRRHVLRHLHGLQGALRDARDARRAERARDPDHALHRRRRRSRARSCSRSPPPPIPGIGTTGGFEFWIQDTGAGDPARLDELTQEFLQKARERPELAGLAHDVPRDHAAAARRRRPRQGDAARRAGPGRVQRDPGAVRLADGEPVQPVQPASGG